MVSKLMKVRTMTIYILIKASTFPHFHGIWSVNMVKNNKNNSLQIFRVKCNFKVLFTISFQGLEVCEGPFVGNDESSFSFRKLVFILNKGAF